jgi:hypothetical protein
VGTRSLGRLATTLGCVGLASGTSLIVFFAVGGPFGTLNDVGNGALGVLSGLLAVALSQPGAAPPPGGGSMTSSLALLGAGVTVVGSLLILTDTTGFFLAGLVSSSGFALIGVWVIALNRWLSSDAAAGWPARRVPLGVAAGAVMCLGFVSVVGVSMGLDDMDTAPVWIHVGGLSWIGTYLLLPIWSIWFGRALTGPAGTRRAGADENRPAG